MDLNAFERSSVCKTTFFQKETDMNVDVTV